MSNGGWRGTDGGGRVTDGGWRSTFFTDGGDFLYGDYFAGENFGEGKVRHPWESPTAAEGGRGSTQRCTVTVAGDGNGQRSMREVEMDTTLRGRGVLSCTSLFLFFL